MLDKDYLKTPLVFAMVTLFYNICYAGKFDSGKIENTNIEIFMFRILSI